MGCISLRYGGSAELCPKSVWIICNGAREAGLPARPVGTHRRCRRSQRQTIRTGGLGGGPVTISLPGEGDLLRSRPPRSPAAPVSPLIGIAAAALAGLFVAFRLESKRRRTVKA